MVQIKEVHVVNFIIHFTPSYSPPFFFEGGRGGGSLSLSLGRFIHSAVRLKDQECSNRLVLVVRRFALHAGCLSTIEFTPVPLFQSSGQPVLFFLLSFLFFCLWVRPQERRVVIDLVAIIKEFTQVDRPLSYQWGLVRESWRIPSWGTIEWVDGHGTLLRNMFFKKILQGSSDDRMKH